MKVETTINQEHINMSNTKSHFIHSLRLSWLPLLALILFLALFKTSVAATKGYKISVKLTNSKDTCLYLAHYYGNKQYLDDTAYLSKKGVFEFNGTENLPEGMYIIAGQSKSRYLDIFLTAPQQLELSCDPADVVKSIKIKGSDENSIFYEYVKFLAGKQTEIEPLNQWKQSHKEKNDSTAIIQARIDKIDKEAKDYIRNFYISNPGLLAAKFVKANNEPDILPFITKPDGKVDSSNIFQVYKKHYFDHLSFEDARILYTPVFTNKIDYYLDKLSVPVLDSLENEIDRLIKLSSVNPETQKYLAWYLTLKYESSEIMGHDALFVYIIRKYMEPGEVEWLYPSVKETIIKRVKAIEPLLLGKIAPNLVMLDTTNYPQALQSVTAKYTLLFFWESTCGHCQKEMPKVLEFYKEFNAISRLEIFAVSGDTSLVKWKEYIKKNKLPWINVNGHMSLSGDYHDIYDIHSTPVMYLLDENKKIITKRLLIDQLSDFLRKREDALKKKAKTD
ncbi:MAG: redoxin domain-containing protein [Bacteroidales bacterium]|nr:redoxin domain-containing protein [Bacteroidales bacterium]